MAVAQGVFNPGVRRRAGVYTLPRAVKACLTCPIGRLSAPAGMILKGMHG